MKKTISFFIGTILFPALVFAHHGFGRFDMNGEIELSGTLTGLEFVNPHSYVNFDIVLADGSIRNMGCEMRAATVLRRSGWTRDMFIEGSQIQINGRPHRDDPTSCYVETITIGDADTLERYQQLDGSPVSQDDRPMRLTNGEPNLSGEWAQEQYILATLPNGNVAGLVPESMLAAIASGEMASSEAPEPGWGPRPVSLTQAGEEAAEILRNEPPEQNPRIACEITSILFDWVFDGPINRITQADNEITIEYGRNLVRTVYMNQETHQAGIVPSRAGHSIGHWENDTLVVDSVGFLPGRIAGTVPASGQLHVVERFTLYRDTLDRIALNREFIAEDPLYFNNQYAGVDTVLVADAPFEIDQCKELSFEYTRNSVADQ